MDVDDADSGGAGDAEGGVAFAACSVAGLVGDVGDGPFAGLGDELPGGELLGKVELEVAARVRLHEQDADDIAVYLAGWHMMVGAGEPDAGRLGPAVLVNRIERTALDIDYATGGLGAEGDQPVVVQASVHALMAAAALRHLRVHLGGCAEDARERLDQAAGFLAASLKALTGARRELDPGGGSTSG